MASLSMAFGDGSEPRPQRGGSCRCRPRFASRSFKPSASWALSRKGRSTHGLKLGPFPQSRPDELGLVDCQKYRYMGFGRETWKRTHENLRVNCSICRTQMAILEVQVSPKLETQPGCNSINIFSFIIVPCPTETEVLIFSVVFP